MLWDPYQVGGQSLIGQVQPGAACPLNWLLFLAPLKDGFIRDASFNWYIALIRFMAALAFYALCRDLGRSPAASILGASAFAFAGYVATTAWPQLLHATIWAPLVFLCSLRALRGSRPLLNSIFSGACLGIAWFTDITRSRSLPHSPYRASGSITSQENSASNVHCNSRRSS